MPKPNITDLPTKKPKTRKDILAFLDAHKRYYTGNSWNLGSSYAVNIKISHLRLTAEERDACYAMLAVDSAHDESGFIDDLEDFDIEHDYEWQIGTNGRSGGYCVLYTGGKKPSGYKSYCPKCWQRNYEVSTPESNRCGKCGNFGRVNYGSTHMMTYTNSTGPDDNDREAWDLERLKELLDVVWAFDVAVENACQDYIAYAMSHTAEEETVMVPKKVMVAVPKE